MRAILIGENGEYYGDHIDENGNLMGFEIESIYPDPKECPSCKLKHIHHQNCPLRND